MLDLPVLRLDPDLPLPAYARVGDAGVGPGPEHVRGAAPARLTWYILLVLFVIPALLTIYENGHSRWFGQVTGEEVDSRLPDDPVTAGATGR